MIEKTFIWIDVNSAFIAYSSVESLLNDGPDYRLVPSVVSGDPNMRGAIVAAASQPAKDLGIRVPEHIHSALNKCPDLLIVKPDFEVYKKWSKKFKEICKEFSEKFESFSIDECVINPKKELLEKYSGAQIANMIKNKIKKQCGFEVTCGVSFNKSFAKIASDYKPGNSVYLLTKENYQKFLWGLPVSRLLFCGPKSTEKLEKFDIKTIGELANTSIEKLKEILGNKHGEGLWIQANGLDESEVVTERAPRKSLSREETFQISITTKEELLKKFQIMLKSALDDLIEEGFTTKRIGIKLRNDSFVDKNYYKTLEDFTSDYDLLYSELEKLVEDNFSSGSIRQIGVKFEKLQS